MNRSAELAERLKERLAHITAGHKPLSAAPKRAEEVKLLDAPHEFGSKHVVVVAVVLLLGVLGTWAWLARAGEQVVMPVTAAAPVATETSAATPTPRPGIYVHVIGAVNKPGVIELPAGARVQAAIQAAGGFSADADPAGLNLAAPVVDGAQIVVGTTAAPKGEIVLPTGPSGSALPGKVNLNTADQGQLETLPGVGPATARAILSWRSANGSFKRVEELQEIEGIGPKTFAKLAPLVDV